VWHGCGGARGRGRCQNPRTGPGLTGITRRLWCDSTLRWFCFWVLGIYGVHGFVMHLFFSDFTAKFIGWPNSPFQFEVAYTNVVFGVVGVVVLFRPRREFTLAINAQRYPVDTSRGRATKYDRLYEAR
jgi:hypothetical protein